VKGILGIEFMGSSVVFFFFFWLQLTLQLGVSRLVYYFQETNIFFCFFVLAIHENVSSSRLNVWYEGKKNYL
jgi:hypothetical protein